MWKGCFGLGNWLGLIDVFGLGGDAYHYSRKSSYPRGIEQSDAHSDARQLSCRCMVDEVHGWV